MGCCGLCLVPLRHSSSLFLFRESGLGFRLPGRSGDLTSRAVTAFFCVCVYVCACVYVWMYVCMYVCVSMYVGKVGRHVGM